MEQGDLSTEKNKVHPQSPIFEERQIESEVYPQSHIPEHAIIHMFSRKLNQVMEKSIE